MGKDKTPIKCTYCFGHGEVSKPPYDDSAECPYCFGSGVEPVQNTCPYCKGDKWTAEHNNHPHPNGDCMGMCPVQVPCETCESSGSVSDEVLEKYHKDRTPSEDSPSDLPF